MKVEFWVVAILAAVAGCRGPSGGGKDLGDSGNAWLNNGATDVGSGSVDGGVDTPDASGLLAPTCADYDVVFEACGECPEGISTCPCLEMFAFSFSTCGYGRCLKSLDCGRACANYDEEAEFMQPPEFFEDLVALQTCFGTHQCEEDADCGSGLCLRESGTELGSCTDGAGFTWCFEDADCVSGLCVPEPSGGGTCSDGTSGWPCNEDAHCVGGATCLLVDAPAQQGDGVCTSGLEMDPCLVDADCQSGICVDPHGDGGSMCVPGEMGQACEGGGVFRCATGEVAQPCNDPSDCLSGFCYDYPDPDGLAGLCTDGGPGDYCTSREHCASGFCSQQPSPPGTSPNVGTCVSGAENDRCFTDDACASSVCAFNDFSNEGVCTTGTSGAPCDEGTDCLNGQCEGATSNPSVECGRDGNSCDGDGVCLRTVCFKGKCL